MQSEDLSKKVEHYKTWQFIVKFKRWVKKYNFLVMIKLKSGNSTSRKNQFFKERRVFLQNIDKISSGEKIYKYFIGSMDDDHRMKKLCIMLPKACKYVKSCK